MSEQDNTRPWAPGVAPVAVVMISLNEAHNLEAVLAKVGQYFRLRREDQRPARGQFESVGDSAHPHHAFIHAHVVQRRLPRTRCLDPQEPVGAARIVQREIGGSHRAGRHRVDIVGGDFARGLVTRREREGDEGNQDGRKTLENADLPRAVTLMAEKAPRHFADLVGGNPDRITYDVFMQMLVLGEIVYD